MYLSLCVCVVWSAFFCRYGSVPAGWGHIAKRHSKGSDRKKDKGRDRDRDRNRDGERERDKDRGRDKSKKEKRDKREKCDESNPKSAKKARTE